MRKRLLPMMVTSGLVSEEEGEHGYEMPPLQWEDMARTNHSLAKEPSEDTELAPVAAVGDKIMDLGSSKVCLMLCCLLRCDHFTALFCFQSARPNDDIIKLMEL